MRVLLTGWSRVLQVGGAGAGTTHRLPYGTAHAVDRADPTVALCGAGVLAVGAPWPRGLGPLCRRCLSSVAGRLGLAASAVRLGRVPRPSGAGPARNTEPVVGHEGKALARTCRGSGQAPPQKGR